MNQQEMQNLYDDIASTPGATITHETAVELINTSNYLAKRNEMLADRLREIRYLYSRVNRRVEGVFIDLSNLNEFHGGFE